MWAFYSVNCLTTQPDTQKQGTYCSWAHYNTDPTYWATGRKYWNIPKSLSFPCHQRACWGCGRYPWALKDLCPGNRQSSFTSQQCIREQENIRWLQHWCPCWTVTAICHHTHGAWQVGAPQISWRALTHHLMMCCSVSSHARFSYPPFCNLQVLSSHLEHNLKLKCYEIGWGKEEQESVVHPPAGNSKEAAKLVKTGKHNTGRPWCSCSHLQLDTTASLCLLPVMFLSRIIKRWGRARPMRIHGKITPGDERAHVDVVGEDIMSD